MLDELTLSAEQAEAVRQIGSWLNQPKAQLADHPVFRLFGYAGSGKTELAREIVRRHPGGLLAAFSGKAAYVLGQRVGRRASTIHSLIYKTGECEGRGSRAFKPCEHGFKKAHPVFYLNRDSALRDAKYLLLDEVSMVNAGLAGDLLWFGRPIIVLGDPAQLPPPENNDDGLGYFTHGLDRRPLTPDVMLTEVHRHRDDGGILDLATALRMGEYSRTQPQYIQARTDAWYELADDLASIDVVICGMNRTRVAINEQARAARGFEGDLPQPGERMICLANDAKLDLLNGQMLTVVEATPAVDAAGEYNVEMVDATDGRKYSVPAYVADLWSPENDKAYTPGTAHLTYGYALTAHKAQGSQWDRVLIVDESNCWSRDDDRTRIPEDMLRRMLDRDEMTEAAMWRYTAATRAVKIVQIVSRMPPC